MTNDNVLDPSDPSHDDVSSPEPERNVGVPESDNESHDRNDRPNAQPSVPADDRAPEEKITGKPISDMAPPGQDEEVGIE